MPGSVAVNRISHWINLAFTGNDVTKDCPVGLTFKIYVGKTQVTTTSFHLMPGKSKPKTDLLKFSKNVLQKRQQLVHVLMVRLDPAAISMSVIQRPVKTMESVPTINSVTSVNVHLVSKERPTK